MLVRCNLGCKNNVTTDASLDLETNEAVCNSCGDVLENISSYAKQAMKMNGDVIRKNNKKAFVFKCRCCKKEMQVIEQDGNMIGVGCPRQDECKFDISDYMQRAISLYSVDEDE